MRVTWLILIEWILVDWIQQTKSFAVQSVTGRIFNKVLFSHFSFMPQLAANFKKELQRI